MLFGRRRRLRELAEREASGEQFWTRDFSPEARTKIRYAWENQVPREAEDDANEAARKMILEDEGLLELVHGGHSMYPKAELLACLHTCDSAFVPTVVEAMARVAAVGEARLGWNHRRSGMAFTESVRIILREHRVSYDLVGVEMVEFSSLEMHVAVVEPAMRLLAGRSDLDRVERPYLEALDEISKGKPQNAITDAATALQEMLLALGCQGNALGPLTKSAQKNGLLGAHDSAVAEGLGRIIDWVSADRSTLGDAHKASSPLPEDAWLTVHVVGALIVRLAGPRRAGSARTP